VVSSSYHSVICMARKDQLNCTTKGREVQFTDVVKMVPLNARPEGLTQRVYHQHGMSTPGSEAKGAFMSDTRSAKTPRAYRTHATPVMQFTIRAGQAAQAIRLYLREDQHLCAKSSEPVD